MRVAYLGPEGTFSHEALMSTEGADEYELQALPTLHDTIMAVQDGSAERAFVPIENSLEGAVNATLDTLAVEAEDVRVVGEKVHQVRHCLIARHRLEPADIETVVSFPQVTAQCAQFLRTRLPGVPVLPSNSTADAVRQVSESDAAWVALGNRLSAGLYGCEILERGVEDVRGNQTRFVWLARDAGAVEGPGEWKTSIVFWGAGDDAPGWLVRCLSEFAFRGVNLTMIESRPRRQALGHYMFFADLEGHEDQRDVAAAIGAVRLQTENLRVLGSYPAA